MKRETRAVLKLALETSTLEAMRAAVAASIACEDASPTFRVRLFPFQSERYPSPYPPYHQDKEGKPLTLIDACKHLRGVFEGLGLTDAARALKEGRVMARGLSIEAAESLCNQLRSGGIEVNLTEEVA